uniref:Putative ribonuclease H-like domain-containing protein n=1 Tax=Tanacetum cinerariifolium TaxID=118510 RepID=A0A699JB24_TANCI|nr:putative ribonuclease H-like domain-containing protein [Tanacetum cinerariifolium]
MSSIGELTLFLGLQVKQKKDGIFINQDKYVAEILRKFRLSEGKSASTPIDAEKPLLKDSDEIYNIDLDHSLKVLSMQEDDTEVQEAVEIVTTAKLMTEVVTAAATQVVAASTPILAIKPKILSITAASAVSTRRRKGVVIRDPEEELTSDTPVDTPKYIKRYHGIKKKPQTESEARKNMIFYLKNTEGYKMDFFKGKKYDEILSIFQAKFDANMNFLFKSREEMEKEDKEIIKSINETPAQKAAKRRKLSEEAQEADALRKRLEIVQDEDDDVFVKATPLAQKVPVVDYQIVVIDNKPKEDLETLWRIVRNRFSTLKPTDFSDEYLLLTLKIMFEEPDGQDAIWRNQKSVHGLVLVKRWKLLTSCGVHVVTLSTIQLFLLVERRSKKNTKCVSAANEEFTAAKHKLMLLEVILNGDSPVLTRLIEGVAQPVAPITVK